MSDERYPIDERYEMSVVDAARRHADRDDPGKQDDPAFVLVDIREADELAVASIDGAVWIPMGDLATRIHEIDAGEDGTIGLICHSGRRSLSAAVALQRAGIDQVLSVAGGIDAWSVRIDPGVPRY